MNRSRNPLALWLLAFLLVFSVACSNDRSETTVVTPTEPPPPGQAPANNSAVFPQAMGICPAAGPCIGDFSVTLFPGDTVAWVFTGGQPPTSSVPAGNVRWPTPGTYNWSSNVCNGPTGSTQCTPAQGTVTFVAPAVVAQLAASLGLIEPEDVPTLVNFLETADVDGWSALVQSGLVSDLDALADALE